MKKVISVIIAVFLLCGVLPTAAVAYDAEQKIDPLW